MVGFPRPILAPPTAPAANNALTLTFPTTNFKDLIAHQHKKPFPWKVVAFLLMVALVVFLVKKYLHQTSLQVPAPSTNQVSSLAGLCVCVCESAHVRACLFHFWLMSNFYQNCWVHPFLLLLLVFLVFFIYLYVYFQPLPLQGQYPVMVSIHR